MDNFKQKLHRLQALELWLSAGGSYQKFELGEQILLGFTTLDDEGNLTTLDNSSLEGLLPTLASEYPQLGEEIKPPAAESAGELWHRVGELREAGVLGAKTPKNPNHIAP